MVSCYGSVRIRGGSASLVDKCRNPLEFPSKPFRGEELRERWSVCEKRRQGIGQSGLGEVFREALRLRRPVLFSSIPGRRGRPLPIGEPLRETSRTFEPARRQTTRNAPLRPILVNAHRHVEIRRGGATSSRRSPKIFRVSQYRSGSQRSGHDSAPSTDRRPRLPTVRGQYRLIDP